jgi:hypothetical protein
MIRKRFTKLLLIHLQVVASVAVPDLVLLANELATMNTTVSTELEVLTTRLGFNTERHQGLRRSGTVPPIASTSPPAKSGNDIRKGRC